MSELGCAHFTPAGGNVFDDLGFAPDEALRLKSASDMMIRQKLAIQSKFADVIASWISERGLSQSEAAAILRVARRRVSDVINKRGVKFSIDELVDLLTRAGKQVELSADHEHQQILIRTPGGWRLRSFAESLATMSQFGKDGDESCLKGPPPDARMREQMTASSQRVDQVRRAN